MSMERPAREKGMTLIELLVTVVAVGILVALAAPSFTSLFARKRLEGSAQELSTDIQYARSTSVARNTPVRITFLSGCYVLHETSLAVSTCSTSSDSRQLKVSQIPTGITLAFSTTPAEITFEPLRGSASALAVTLSSNLGSWQLRASVSVVGRVELCSPSSSTPGYRACI